MSRRTSNRDFRLWIIHQNKLLYCTIDGMILLIILHMIFLIILLPYTEIIVLWLGCNKILEFWAEFSIALWSLGLVWCIIITWWILFIRNLETFPRPKDDLNIPQDVIQKSNEIDSLSLGITVKWWNARVWVKSNETVNVDGQFATLYNNN